MKRLALLAALLLAAPALAQTGSTAPKPVPPPANLKDATIDAWIKARIDASGFTFATHDDDSAYYLAPAKNQLDAETRRFVWVRRERFSANDVGVRSSMALYEFDCAEGRRRSLALDAYGGSNLAQPIQARDVDIDDKTRPQWSYARNASLGEALLFNACALKDAAFGPAPIP